MVKRVLKDLQHIGGRGELLEWLVGGREARRFFSLILYQHLQARPGISSTKQLHLAVSSASAVNHLNVRRGSSRRKSDISNRSHSASEERKRLQDKPILAMVIIILEIEYLSSTFQLM